MTDALARTDTSTALAPQLDIASELPAIFTLASKLIQARGFIPEHFKGEGEIVAALLAGRELGLPPMVALRSLYLVKGKVTLAAEVMLALMIRAGVKVEWQSDGTPAQGNVAKLKLSRPGHEPYTSTFGLEDAQRAGLTNNDTYKKHQGSMLRARCVSSAARAYCPDVLSGCYVPGELDDAAPVREVKARRTLDDVASSGDQRAAATYLDGRKTAEQLQSEADEAEVEHHEARADARAQARVEHDADGVTQDAYTVEHHIGQLPQVKTETTLKVWLETLRELSPTKQQWEHGTAALKARCAELNIDPKKLAKKQEG